MERAIAGDSGTARKVGCESGAAILVVAPHRRGEQGLRSNGHPLESSGGTKISGGEDGGGAATLVLLLGDEATMDNGTGGLREGGHEVEGNHTHPPSEEGEHGDIREVVADTEAGDDGALARVRRVEKRGVVMLRGCGHCREVIKLSLDSGKKKKE
ncbi:hypothetical protein B296_00018064 [Ensete ventricosum]|uniref:Uncharacterized protein n=1 Tax=Ensete ventricosum TaxID=4639 RepID=A0A426XTL7_ENSVE|nr:hypothetical protein B296_00018064 [Ensete ventricosum]